MILDTNGLSAAAEGDAELAPILRNAVEVSIPAIVLGEYLYGISRSRDRALYEEWLAKYLPAYRILNVDEETAASYSVIRTELRKAGTPIPSNDAWIAALCRQHSMPLVSRDRHFDAVQGLTRLTW